jgi:hypothetical protein
MAATDSSYIITLHVSSLLGAKGASQEFLDVACCGKLNLWLSFPQHATSMMKEPQKVASI